MDVTNRALMTAAALVAAGTLTAATAHAEPPAVDQAPQVHYTASVDGDTAVITVDPSSELSADGAIFQIRTASGQVLAGVPLELHVDDIAFPIDVTLTGNTARLTPSLDIARAQYRPITQSVAGQVSSEREQDALARVGSTLAKGVGIAGVLGAAGAGVIGCLLGGIAGAVATAPLAMMLGAGPVIGCLIGAVSFAPTGAVTGVLRAAVPVAIPAFLEYFTTVNT
ncbi:hypothetical protein IU450_33215 [Nocardia abscessus]|uniref:hypothetical protein n=1 Tax=Nocardia abscessus TaxID=120957 RepID=UPI0018932CBC|nr:hypothetical protein [Nocardia abscessus]MBF6340718.1 hypothetical protein [Nocardia abscessus]